LSGEEGDLVSISDVVTKLLASNILQQYDDRKVKIDDLVQHIENLSPSAPQLKPGVYVIIGKTRTGKTQWLRELISHESLINNAILLNHDEPKLKTDVIGTSRGLDELIECFEFIKDAPQLSVICLDGIRTIQYESTGTTLSGGVNSGFFRFLTDAGNAAVDAGVVCLFTYNPNTERDEAYQVVTAMTDGSIQGIIDLNERVIRSRYHKRESYSIDESMSILFETKPDNILSINDQNTDTTEL